MSKENNVPISERIKEFEDLIEWFNSDDFKLEEALEKYKQAATLAESIEMQLGEIKNEVTVLKQKFDA